MVTQDVPIPNREPTRPEFTVWIEDTLLGEVAITLCIIAVALVGFSMLTGQSIVLPISSKPPPSPTLRSKQSDH